MSATETWSDPTSCPFCGGELASPGSGFVDHLDESPDCHENFETWRERVSGDMTHGWSG